MNIQAGDVVVSQSSLLTAGDTICIMGVGFHRSINWLPLCLKSIAARVAAKFGVDLYVMRNRGTVTVTEIDRENKTLTIA